MSLTIIMLMLVSIIFTVLMIMCMLIQKKSFMDREKMSPFECGFDPKSPPRSPFSIQFFLISILFLIFDIEIVIILPMIFTLNKTFPILWLITVTMFILILLLGLFHEWKNGILEWMT